MHLTRKLGRCFLALAFVSLVFVAGCESGEAREEQERIQAKKDEAFQRVMGVLPPKDAEASIDPYLRDLNGSVEPSNGGGSVDVGISFTNASNRRIKYATFRIVPYNAVGDPVGLTRNSMNRERLKYTGPLEPGENSGPLERKRVWSSSTIIRYDVEWVTIEFMDGHEVDVVPTRPIRIKE